MGEVERPSEMSFIGNTKSKSSSQVSMKFLKYFHSPSHCDIQSDAAGMRGVRSSFINFSADWTDDRLPPASNAMDTNDDWRRFRRSDTFLLRHRIWTGQLTSRTAGFVSYR